MLHEAKSLMIQLVGAVMTARQMSPAAWCRVRCDHGKPMHRHRYDDGMMMARRLMPPTRTAPRTSVLSQVQTLSAMVVGAVLLLSRSSSGTTRNRVTPAIPVQHHCSGRRRLLLLPLIGSDRPAVEVQIMMLLHELASGHLQFCNDTPRPPMAKERPRPVLQRRWKNALLLLLHRRHRRRLVALGRRCLARPIRRP